VKAGELKSNPANETEITGAIADYSQEKFDIKGAFDGKKGDPNNGWGIGSQAGVPHYAAFASRSRSATKRGCACASKLTSRGPVGFTSPASACGSPRPQSR